MSGEKKVNDSINNIMLSKGAINYLDNQLVKDGDNKIIEAHFIFQIIYAIKNLSNWYCCSLLDQNSKFGGFCIKYDKLYGEPKDGDIIETNKIQIVKLPNRATNLYFCDNVKRLSKSKKMKVDPNIVDSVTKKRKASSKKDYSNRNYRLLGNVNSKNNDNEIDKNFSNKSEKKILSNNLSKMSDHKTNINKNSSDKKSTSQKKYTLISELTSFTNNPIFLLKCKSKSDLKEYRNDRWQGPVQNYLFYDTKGDKIQGVAFQTFANYFDKIINVGSIYEIYNIYRKRGNPEYNLSKCEFQLIFNYSTRIEQCEDHGEFKDISQKINNIENDEFIPISNLVDINKNKILNIKGFILDDKGITKKIKENQEICQYRRLIIGDNTLHSICVKIWENKIQEEKKYLKGDIVYISYLKLKEYYNNYELNSLGITEIFSYNNPEKENELYNFYKKHPEIREYKNISYVVLNSNPNIKYKFIRDFIDNYNLEYNENNNNNKIVKISGIVENLNHRENNYYLGCAYCNKKIEKICPNCNTDKSKLVFIFNIRIKDCSDYLWIEFYDEIAEDFLGITADYYDKLIKENNKIALKQIDKKILYHSFSFIGKYKGPPIDEGHGGVFFVIQYNEIDGEYFKNLIKQIK